jgi:hypothetical protein
VCWVQPPAVSLTPQSYPSLSIVSLLVVCPPHLAGCFSLTHLRSPLTYPTLRSSYTLSPPLVLLGARVARNTKLTIYKDIINFYSQDPAQKRYAELWKDLHSTEVQEYPIGIRVERANQGKDAANQKYKEGNWFGAMYTYALAWGCLLPYHLDAFAVNDPVREEVGKL